ncbi:MAG TPA: hypothetical protein VH207_11860 [Chthoniobacterales bacterium]|jgi:hypothetical protein|nr:hypothetical protein [Chthoniobacterales bacterium]
MKRPNILFLLAALALGACQTAHDAAVSTFRVIDAPHQYVRRKLGIDEEPQTTTTTTTSETTYTGTAPYPPQQPYASPQPYGAQPAPPPPVQTQRQITTNESAPAPESTTSTRVTRSEPQPTAPSEPPPTAPPRTVSSKSETLPYAKPVPGKPGYVFSPYDPNGGYVDVKGYSPGQKVKDPYSGKIFLVP